MCCCTKGRVVGGGIGWHEDLVCLSAQRGVAGWGGVGRTGLHLTSYLLLAHFHTRVGSLRAGRAVHVSQVARMCLVRTLLHARERVVWGERHGMSAGAVTVLLSCVSVFFLLVLANGGGWKEVGGGGNGIVCLRTLTGNHCVIRCFALLILATSVFFLVSPLYLVHLIVCGYRKVENHNFVPLSLFHIHSCTGTRIMHTKHPGSSHTRTHRSVYALFAHPPHPICTHPPGGGNKTCYS